MATSEQRIGIPVGTLGLDSRGDFQIQTTHDLFNDLVQPAAEALADGLNVTAHVVDSQGRPVVDIQPLPAAAQVQVKAERQQPRKSFTVSGNEKSGFGYEAIFKHKDSRINPLKPM